MFKKNFTLFMCLILLSVSLFSAPVKSSIAGTIHNRLAAVQSIDNVQQESVTKAVYDDPIVDIQQWSVKKAVYGDPAVPKQLSDTVPPSISTTDPASGAKNISADKTVTVSFSEDITAGSRYKNIAIKDASGRSVNMTKSINGNTLVLNPVNNLNSGVTYKVTIPAKAVKDLSDNSLKAVYSFSFTTNTVDNTWMEFLNGSDDFWVKDMANNTYSGSVSNNYLQNGIPSYRFELRKTDPIVKDGKRSEIERAQPERAASESTYNFSVLLPKGGSEDYALDPEGDEIIAQWHNTPDPGEEWTYPPLALHVQGDGHYYLWRVWDEDPLSTDEKMRSEGKMETHDLGSYLDDKGKWVDWSFHVKWGWLSSQQPIIEVYKNGSKVFELKDKPNTTNDIIGNYMQCGIYKWEWGHPEVDQSILTSRVLYYNNVSIKYQ